MTFQCTVRILSVLTVLAGVSGPAVLAQSETKPCYSAGKGPQFTITLEGKHVNTITNTNATARSDTTAPPDHISSVSSPSAGPSSPGVFTVTMNITANATNGKYSLTEINASGDGFSVTYRAPGDFKAPAPFEVCTAFEKPSIKSVIEHP